jgi:hypothetical protein
LWNSVFCSCLFVFKYLLRLFCAIPSTLWIYLFVLEDYLCSCGIPFEVVEFWVLLTIRGSVGLVTVSHSGDPGS